MAAKPHIVILSRGGREWTGGRMTTLYLLHALICYRGASNSFDLSALIEREEELIHYEQVRPHLRTCAFTERAQAPYTLFNRVRWRLARDLRKQVNPRIDEALQRMGATFAYPLRSLTTPSADWIPDFQYRHLPEGSNPEEIAGRKRDFADCIKRAQRVVLSSADAQKDCHELFPASIGKTYVLRFRVFIDESELTLDPLETVRRYNLPGRFVLISNALAPNKKIMP